MKQAFSTILLLVSATSLSVFAKGKIEEGKREKSCIPDGDSSPALISLGSSGFEKEQMKVVEGVYGPELHIGKAKIFLDAGDTRREDEGGKKGDLNNTWCIIDPDINKKEKASSPKKADCSLLGATEGKKSEPITIKTESGATIKIEPKYNSQTKAIELFFDVGDRNHGGTNPKNRMVLGGVAEKKGKMRVSNLRLESRGYPSGPVNGVLESQVEGYLSDGGSNDKDPNAGKNFTKCISQNEAKGQLRTSEDGAPTTAVDLSGSRIIMRGREKYGIDQYKGNEDTGRGSQPQYMTTGTGRN